MMARALTSISQDIGEVSPRWKFESWPDNLDVLVAGNNGTASAGEDFDYDQVIKNGPLSVSSKTAFGWHWWRKRWFVLTRRALIFFKTDPSLQEIGAEVNLILGGIILKKSGRVEVREKKKSLTLIFPDGMPFALKAETSQELHEWKTALEYALKQARK